MKWSIVMLSVTSSFKEFALVYKYLFFSIQQYHFLVKGQLPKSENSAIAPYSLVSTDLIHEIPDGLETIHLRKNYQFFSRRTEFA